MVTIEPENLFGCTFLKDSEVYEQSFRALVVQAIVDKEIELKQQSEYLKSVCEVPNSSL
jgi:hypothetical protein